MRPLLLFAFVALSSCIAPPSPAERLAYSATELNAATRFARMDIALGMVAKDAQSDFMARHAPWHTELRIVDVEVQGMRLLTSDSAEVQLFVAWHRLDETNMRGSSVVQRWTQDREGWMLAEEMRVGGAPGIFGEPPRASQGKKAPELSSVTTQSWH
jgi:hypothetical protein